MPLSDDSPLSGGQQDGGKTTGALVAAPPPLVTAQIQKNFSKLFILYCTCHLV